MEIADETFVNQLNITGISPQINDALEEEKNNHLDSSSPLLASKQVSRHRGNAIEVFCRIREDLRVHDDDLALVTSSERSLYFNNSCEFTFNRVFDQGTEQEEVYHQVIGNNSIKKAFEGTNVGCVAYGQTSSGKTYTLFGNRYEKKRDIDTDVKGGLVEKVFDEIFRYRDIFEAENNSLEVLVSMSFIEIYNYRVRDLLDDEYRQRIIRGKSVTKGLRVHFDSDFGGWTDARKVEIESPSEARECVGIGLKRRVSRETNMNKRSSRSHCIVQVFIDIYNPNTMITQRSVIQLADLAGSESVKKGNVVTDEGINETKMINQSLSALLDVVVALQNKERKITKALKKGSKTSTIDMFIPYRNSPLTKLLANCFGGDAISKVIITCTPDPVQKQESLSTLTFGSRCMMIKNRPKKSTIQSLDAGIIAATKRLRITNRKKQRELNHMQDETERLRGLVKPVIDKLCVQKESFSREIFDRFPTLHALLPQLLKNQLNMPSSQLLPATIEEIPIEILKIIQSYLGSKDLLRSRLVSKSFSLTDGSLTMSHIEAAKASIIAERVRQKETRVRQLARFYA